MHRLMSLKEFEREWRAALGLTDTIRLEDSATATQGSLKDDSARSENEDPFDCSSLQIPPTHALVDEVVHEFVHQWRDLDERKVVNQGVTARDSDGGSASSRPATGTNSAALPKWYTRRVRLPEHFDYASKRTSPPEDDGEGDRVVSLVDPSQTLLYHTELWKLFQSIPTVGTIEHNATKDARLPHMQKLSERLVAEGTRPTPDTVHALARLRYSDRHDAIPARPYFRERNGIVTHDQNELVSSIQFECWRRQLKRGSSPDANRMSIEFLGEQTLLDFHMALVELTDDELWNRSIESSSNKDSATNHSGYFFIEGIFYTYGSVDYVSNIQTWLRSGNKARRRRRAEHLGFPQDVMDQPLPVRSMAETCLRDVAMRLGYRYVHVHHGDVECSVFCVDRRLSLRATTPYPILHDVWTHDYILPDCEACQSCPASIATSTTCESTLGHAALCEACCRQLNVQNVEPEKVEMYSVWRNQGDLSVGASKDKFF